MLVRRRGFLLAAGALAAAPLVVRAQAEQKIRRIGFLGISSDTPAVQGLLNEFREGMATLGWAEGRNYARVDRWAHGDMARLPALAAELVGLRPDALMAGATESAVALKNATRAVPIVAIGTSDPVEIGLALNLARPGGNITGPSFAFPELLAKQLEILKEAFPRASRIGALMHGEMVTKPEAHRRLKNHGKALRLRIDTVEVSKPQDFQPAFQAMRDSRAEVVLVVGSGFMFAHRKALADLALRYRLPSVWNIPTQADAGGLIAYGVDVRVLWRRAAVFMDKILRGANPGEIPFERPSKFELVVNLKTANALGISIPRPLLLRADRVIE